MVSNESKAVADLDLKEVALTPGKIYSLMLERLEYGNNEDILSHLNDEEKTSVYFFLLKKRDIASKEAPGAVFFIIDLIKQYFPELSALEKIKEENN